MRARAEEKDKVGRVHAIVAVGLILQQASFLAGALSLFIPSTTSAVAALGRPLDLAEVMHILNNAKVGYHRRYIICSVCKHKLCVSSSLCLRLVSSVSAFWNREFFFLNYLNLCLSGHFSTDKAGTLFNFFCFCFCCVTIDLLERTYFFAPSRFRDICLNCEYHFGVFLSLHFCCLVIISSASLIMHEHLTRDKETFHNQRKKLNKKRANTMMLHDSRFLVSVR